MNRCTVNLLSGRAREARLSFFRCQLFPERSPADCGGTFLIGPERPLALALECSGGAGAFQSYVEVRFAGGGGFSFKPADVSAAAPLFSSRLEIAVTAETDDRGYAEIARSVAAAGLETFVRRAEEGEEPSLSAAARLEWHRCPTFLSLPGNARLFEAGFRGFPIEEKQHMDLYDYVVPRFNWDRLDFGGGAERVVYRYLLGRGMGCKTDLRRSLFKGVLPMLCARLRDGGIVYSAEYFADALFCRPAENPGTLYLEADAHSAAHVLSPKQDAARRAAPPVRDEDKPVLRMRVRMKNPGRVSAYAYLRLPHINTPVMAESDKLPQRYDRERGYGMFGDRVYMTARVNGAPADAIECAWLLPPGGTVTAEITLFFEPVTPALAAKAKASFVRRKRIAAEDWSAALGGLADWRLPEKAVDEAVKAGFLQLKASCFGERESDIVAPCMGVYSPIATEAIGIVSVLSSFGDGDFAKKCTNYFFAKQNENGFIQNMVNYMAETGGALVLAGRIYRENPDDDWLFGLKDHLVRAVRYLGEWIARNADERRGGRGLIDGQVADPVDPYRSWSLNALAYRGLCAAAELLSSLDGEASREAAALAGKLGESIRAAWEEAKIRGLLVPLKSGEWAPLTAPWADDRTGCCLHLEGGSAVTHASAVLKDSLLSGATVFAFGILSPTGPDADDFVDVQSDLFTQELTEFSQPYYNAVPYLNLYRGERNAFLKEYYTALMTMSDRETKSFWEHYFLATPHKTSEQGAFLLRTRMMLWYEREEKLYLLAGVPGAWLEGGKRIYIKDAICAFGRFTLDARAEGGRVEIGFNCDWRLGPVETVWRLPGRAERAERVASGSYRYIWN